MHGKEGVGLMADDKNKKGGPILTISVRTLVIVIIVVLVIVIGGVVLGRNWNHWFGTNTPETEAFIPDIDPNASESKENTEQAQAEEAASIKIPGYPSITLPAGQTNVQMELWNPDGNPCYFTFELVLKDSDEVLYTSKLVPPGDVISDVTLSRALDAGEYQATLRITTTSLEDGSAMNGANVETVLIVQ